MRGSLQPSVVGWELQRWGTVQQAGGLGRFHLQRIRKQQWGKVKENAVGIATENHHNACWSNEHQVRIVRWGFNFCLSGISFSDFKDPSTCRSCLPRQGEDPRRQGMNKSFALQTHCPLDDTRGIHWWLGSRAMLKISRRTAAACCVKHYVRDSRTNMKCDEKLLPVARRIPLKGNGFAIATDVAISIATMSWGWLLDHGPALPSRNRCSARE